MSDSSTYVPAKIWVWDKPNGGQFANINRPTAGARFEKNCRWDAIRCSSILSRRRTG